MSSALKCLKASICYSLVGGRAWREAVSLFVQARNFRVFAGPFLLTRCVECLIALFLSRANGPLPSYVRGCGRCPALSWHFSEAHFPGVWGHYFRCSKWERGCLAERVKTQAWLTSTGHLTNILTTSHWHLVLGLLVTPRISVLAHDTAF